MIRGGFSNREAGRDRQPGRRPRRSGGQMSTGTAVLIAVVVLVVVLAILAGVYWRNRRAALRQRFGPEYDRAVQERGGRLRAERDLTQRERLHDKLDLRPLSEESRRRYAGGVGRRTAGFCRRPRARPGKGGRLGRPAARRARLPHRGPGGFRRRRCRWSTRRCWKRVL